MKKLVNWLSEVFDGPEYRDISIDDIGEALSDPQVRARWMEMMIEELKRIHMEVDKRLLSASEMGLLDLCARRQAYQDILDFVLSAKRQVKQEPRHNPAKRPIVDLDRLTA